MEKTAFLVHNGQQRCPIGIIPYLLVEKVTGCHRN
jgi:hypothetical protein